MLIALAVATAPVAAALASANAATHAAHKKAADDCHKKGAAHCPDCGAKADSKAKCPGDGSKCCKLTGTIAGLPSLVRVVAARDAAVDSPEPPDRSLRPLPPPPRA